MPLTPLRSWGRSEYGEHCPDGKTLLRHAKDLGLYLERRAGSWYIDTMRRKYKDLPPNLYPNRDAWKYRMPDGRYEYFAGTKAEAIRRATTLNARLAENDPVISRILGHHKLSEALDMYWSEFSIKDRAANTRTHMRRIVARIRRELGNEYVEALTRKRIAEFLENDKRNQMRTILIDVLDIAVAAGWMDINEAEKTRKKVPPKKVRPALDYGTYQIAYGQSEDWMQILMDVLLLTTQRLGDVLNIKLSDIDNNQIPIIQQKTSMPIMIEMGPRLAEAVSRARAYPVAGPYLIRRRKLRAQDPRPKPVSVWTAEHYWRRTIKPIMSPYPTLHEIRGLGITLARNASLDAQTLAGHSDSRMTDAYDHEVRFKEAGTL